MPSTNQKAGESNTYQSHHARMLQTKPKGVILSIRPMTEQDARRWLGEANRLEAKQDVIEHFAEQVKRLR